MTILQSYFAPFPAQDDIALVRKQIAQSFGFTPPDAFVADLIRFVDGDSDYAFHFAGGVDALTQLTANVYGFRAPLPYIEALARFVAEMEHLKAMVPYA